MQLSRLLDKRHNERMMVMEQSPYWKHFSMHSMHMDGTIFAARRKPNRSLPCPLQYRLLRPPLPISITTPQSAGLMTWGEGALRAHLEHSGPLDYGLDYESNCSLGWPKIYRHDIFIVLAIGPFKKLGIGIRSGKVCSTHGTQKDSRAIAGPLNVDTRWN
jgi:hypothetical protein